MRKSLLTLLVFLTALFAATPSYSQDTEERFHDLFVTAGYSTAFGAALGAAVLGLTNKPASHLRYIYAGASLGFIGGSILGGYVIFSPMLITEDTKAGDIIADNTRDGWNISPLINGTTGLVTGANLGFNFKVN